MEKSRAKYSNTFLDCVRLVVVLVSVFIIFSVLKSSFLSTGNLVYIARQTAVFIPISLGMTMVLLIGGIDLSVAAVASFASLLFGSFLVDRGMDVYSSAAIVIACGALIGLCNGAIIVFGKLPPFVVTLGMMQIIYGAAQWFSESRTIYLATEIPDWPNRLIARLIPPFFLIALLATFLMQVGLVRTVLGRYTFAVGLNETATKYAGIRTGLVKLWAYLFCSAASAAGGVMLAMKLKSVKADLAVGHELTAIAAAVIGGTSLSGGRGSAVGTLLGVAILCTLEAGMVQYNVEDYAKKIVTGSVLVAAMLLGPMRGLIWKAIRRIAGQKIATSG